MCQTITGIIEAALRRQEVHLAHPLDLSLGDLSVLEGIDGDLAASALSAIEEMVKLTYGIDVSLAVATGDPAGTSPFATLGSLTDHVSARLSLALERALD